MARKADLRRQRANTVINTTSKRQEKSLMKAVRRCVEELMENFPGIRLQHDTQWMLADIVGRLRREYQDVPFHYYHETSAMRPDGGILSVIVDGEGPLPILVSEKKNQGTNDLRALEGKPPQAKGNAIERLGKNVIGFRTALRGEAITPFVCFGDGVDFADTSSILDRVVTIAMFGELGRTVVHDEGASGDFDRGSFHFKVSEWTEDEMFEICRDICERSVLYYMSKYGRKNIIPDF